jgi:hypothetical protein
MKNVEFFETIIFLQLFLVFNNREMNCLHPNFRQTAQMGTLAVADMKLENWCRVTVSGHRVISSLRS